MELSDVQSANQTENILILDNYNNFVERFLLINFYVFVVVYNSKIDIDNLD